jgi:hypothetical protein
MKIVIDRIDILDHFATKMGVCHSQIELSFDTNPTGANLSTTKVREALVTLWDEAQRLARATDGTFPRKISLVGAVGDICPQATLAERKEFVEEKLLLFKPNTF